MRRGSAEPEPFVTVSHELEFYPNGVVRGGELRFGTAAGASVPVVLSELMAPLSYVGFGYLDGWTDRLGLGAYRGPQHLEADRYDVSDVTRVRDLSGGRDFGAHTLLDQPFRISAGGQSGCMEVVAGLRPGHQRYRLDVEGQH
ncbi:hypothetical protein [[Mycobacterium] vasticus]|uniref:Bacterial surface antigen (D15) domain-containing protein n=1 Tax=[Mycobacterium] vasticus TaxID=2875777 RepID=A0ABU5Z2R9_9MYCO|nr:hypothetical protein [Mycolicibacter sp. MYC017]MEB3071697.1 hypothetical protein [Mycolicibacter sp. MYC017]